LTWLIKSRR
jgi:hypothetical protein